MSAPNGCRKSLCVSAAMEGRSDQSAGLLESWGRGGLL